MSGPIQLPVQAVEWTCHAATTIKDASGAVLAECSGHGRYSDEDAAIAGEIVRRVNAATELLAAAEAFVKPFEGIEMVEGSAVALARAAIAKAGSTT